MVLKESKMNSQKPKFKEGDKVKEISSGREALITPGGGVKIDDGLGGKEGGTSPLIYIYQIKYNDNGKIGDAREDALEVI